MSWIGRSGLAKCDMELLLVSYLASLQVKQVSIDVCLVSTP